jgi:hypothetical protein
MPTYLPRSHKNDNNNGAGVGAGHGRGTAHENGEWQHAIRTGFLGFQGQCVLRITLYSSISHSLRLRLVFVSAPRHWLAPSTKHTSPSFLPSPSLPHPKLVPSRSAAHRERESPPPLSARETFGFLYDTFTAGGAAKMLTDAHLAEFWALCDFA